MNNVEITVKNSGWIPRFSLEEKERGSLFSADDSQVPFPIRRVYTISGVADENIKRGTHAHKKTDQVLFVIQGSLLLELDDGKMRQTLTLTRANDGVRLGPKLWHELTKFTPDCVVLVLASAPYDEADYIRSYEEFKTYVSTL